MMWPTVDSFLCLLSHLLEFRAKILSHPLKLELPFKANMSSPDIKKEVLVKTMSLQQHYSPLHDNNDNIYDNGITLMDVRE